MYIDQAQNMHEKKTLNIITKFGIVWVYFHTDTKKHRRFFGTIFKMYIILFIEQFLNII
jgi:hypothetical protein